MIYQIKKTNGDSFYCKNYEIKDGLLITDSITITTESIDEISNIFEDKKTKDQLIDESIEEMEKESKKIDKKDRWKDFEDLEKKIKKFKAKKSKK